MGTCCCVDQDIEELIIIRDNRRTYQVQEVYAPNLSVESSSGFSSFHNNIPTYLDEEFQSEIIENTQLYEINNLDHEQSKIEKIHSSINISITSFNYPLEFDN